MSVTRQERERAVLDLYYNQGKSVREIAKEARISFRDIGAILNKASEDNKEISKGKNNNKRAPRKTKYSCLCLHKLTNSFLKERLQ
jgi:transposase